MGTRPSQQDLPAAGAARSTPPCPSCGEIFDRPTHFCFACGADLRGLGPDADTLVGASAGEPADRARAAAEAELAWLASEAGGGDGSPGDRTAGDPLLGRTIDGRYRILEKLGEGGMGSVFKAEHVRMGKVCALKVLRPELLEGGREREMRERFRQEARIVSRLVAVNTIQVFDFGEAEDGALYLVMEYVRGRPLSEALGEVGGRLSEARVARIAAQVLRSLAEAHEAGIVHRDVKPQNVMLLDLRDRKDFVKVLDFGIAKIVGGRERGRTGYGEIVGTPSYLSPEQARGEPLDGRSDLYALGAMMFELLTGRAPYLAETPLGVVSAHLTEPVPDVTAVAPDASVGPAMRRILSRALAKAPQDRFESADAMRAALDEVLGGEEITGSRPVLPVDDTGELAVASRRDFERFERSLLVRRTLVPLLVLAVLALGLGAAWGFLQRAEPPPTAESEPNDHPNQASPLVAETVPDLATLQARATSPGGEGRPVPLRTMSGFLGKRISRSEGDLDWYRVEVPGPDPKLLYLELAGIPNMDLVLELQGELQPGVLSVRARSDTPGEGAYEGLPDLRVEPGTWYVLVRQVQVAPAEGRMPLPVENVSDPYRLTAVLRPVEAGAETEPNDAPEEASALAPSTAARGFLGVAGQEDWWRLEVPARARLTVALEVPEQVRASLEVLRVDGDRRRRYGGKEGRRFGEDLELRTPRLRGGAVYVRVVTAQGSNLLDPYVLRADVAE